MVMIWLIWISLEFKILIVSVIKCLNGSEIQQMTTADCVFFLHLTDIPLNLTFHLDFSVSDSEFLFNLVWRYFALFW